MLTTSQQRKVFLGLALFLCLGCVKSPADIAKLPVDARTALEGGEVFTITRKVNQIPSAALLAVGNDFKMADAGRPFQESDEVFDEKLPWRQLQFAAISKNYVLIHHARGGRGLSYYFVLLKKSGDDFSIVWTAWGPRCPDFQDFLKELKSHGINDSSNVSY